MGQPPPGVGLECGEWSVERGDLYGHLRRDQPSSLFAQSTPAVRDWNVCFDLRRPAKKLRDGLLVKADAQPGSQVAKQVRQEFSQDSHSRQALVPLLRTDPESRSIQERPIRIHEFVFNDFRTHIDQLSMSQLAEKQIPQ